jgi:dTDP-4-dehydrorhamnose 3,5-epimerase
MIPLFSELPVSLPGVRLLEPRVFRDERGAFVKTYHEDTLRAAGINFVMKEEFYSLSGKGVLRGMHFQIPPEDHAKLVYCVHGRVLDVLLDLRRSSPTFGKSASRELSTENRLMFYIPAGIAHGFLSREEGSVMVYKTTTVHSPACDAGIRWDSFNFDWGLASPVLSPRDAGLPAFADFMSPFA